MFSTVIAGVDTLDIGYGIEQYNNGIDFDELARCKEVAQSTENINEFSGIELNGVRFMVQRVGSKSYEYILINADMTVKINSKAHSGLHNPEVFVSYRSEFLWGSGWHTAVKTVREWLDGFAVVCYEKVSRVDLCADIQAELPVLDNDLKQISTRARTKGIKVENEMYSKMVFGKRTTGYVAGVGDLMCRIYNKSYEIKKHDKVWFEDLWLKNGARDTDNISRVEFQCRRDFLKEMHIDSTNDLKILIGTLWNYLTCKWLRLVNQVKDRNKVRLRNMKFWDSVVRAGEEFGVAYEGMKRVRVRKPQAQRLLAQARGIMVSIGALGAVTLSQSAVWVGIETVREYLKKIENDETMFKAIENRMYKLNNVPLPY